ncbi:MAG: glycosyltransferase family 4 protein [Planctomycetes bacterium]|nr:glycosyltransferase family 4 protein [Planctomycetota bacterium]
MRLYVFSRVLPCHGVGGMELIAWMTSIGLARRGHEVAVFTTETADGQRCNVPESLQQRLGVHYLPSSRPGRYSRHWWVATQDAFRREASKCPPDAVLSVSVGARAVLDVCSRIPVVMQAHGTSLGEIRTKLRSRNNLARLTAGRNLLSLARDLVFYSKISGIVAVGHNVAADLTGTFLRRFVNLDQLITISNGIDTEQFAPCEAQRRATRSELSLSESAPMFLCASRLHREKGIHLAIDAFADLDQLDSSLVIVGDGPQRSDLERLARARDVEQRVHFVGAVAHEQVARWLNAADVFVFTTLRDEGAPLNVLEALSVGLPVVVSESVGRRFPPLRSVFLVNPDNRQAVSGCMQLALRAPGDGRDFVVREHSLDRMCVLYESFIYRIVGMVESESG